MRTLLATIVAVVLGLFCLGTAVFAAPGDSIPASHPSISTDLDEDCVLTGSHAKELLELIADLQRQLDEARARGVSQAELDALRKELEELKATRTSVPPTGITAGTEPPAEEIQTGHSGWFWALAATGGAPLGTPATASGQAGFARIDGWLRWISNVRLGLEAGLGLGGWGLEGANGAAFMGTLQGNLVVAWESFSIFGGESASLFQSPYKHDDTQWYGNAALGGGVAIHVEGFLARISAGWVHWSRCPEWGGFLLSFSIGSQNPIGDSRPSPRAGPGPLIVD